MEEPEQRRRTMINRLVIYGSNKEDDEKEMG